MADDGVSYPPANLAGLQSQIAAKADVSAIPLPASSTPPGVADISAVGSAAPYARSDHTHASKARKQRVTGINTTTYTWTYALAFGSGVVPIVNGIAEDPANSATDCYNVQVVGVPTNVSCQFRIIRQSTGLLSLLTGALSINPTPGNINLHLTALEP